MASGLSQQNGGQRIVFEVDYGKRSLLLEMARDVKWREQLEHEQSTSEDHGDFRQ